MIDSNNYWEVAPDGKESPFNGSAAAAQSAPIIAVQNWQAELKRK